MKKKYIIPIIILLIILISSITFYFLKKDMNSKKTSDIKTFTIPSIEQVFVNGSIVPKKTKNIYLDLSRGELYKTHITNGQSVEVGDKLITYKNPSIHAQVEQLRLQLNSIKDQKKSLLHNDSVKLYESDNSNDANINVNPSLNIDNQIKFYEDQISSLRDSEYVSVTSPINGKVILNDSINDTSSPYITVKSTDFYIDGNVNEKDHYKLNYGQIANIKILANNKTIKGKIFKVSDIPSSPVSEGLNLNSNESNSTNSMSNYKVSLSLDSQDNLVEGYHVQASICLEQKNIEIPKSSIIETNKKTYVFKKVNNKLDKQLVSCKKNNTNDKVAIYSGLKPEDQIITNPNSNMKDGMAIE